MATTKTAAKKTTARKPAAKKTAARKPAAKKTATGQTASKQTAAFVADVNEFIDDASDRAEDAFETALRYAREAAYTYVGAGFVIQDRVAQRKFDRVDYRTFLDEAKTKGEAQLSEIQSKIEPIAAKFTQAVEPIVDRIEETLPKQVKDAVEANRDRVRDLLSR